MNKQPAPLCKTCGKREWGHTCQPPRSLRGRQPIPIKDATHLHTAPKGAKVALLPSGHALVAPINAQPYLVSPEGEVEVVTPKFDKVAYQREYMRLRRAKQKKAKK